LTIKQVKQMSDRELFDGVFDEMGILQQIHSGRLKVAGNSVRCLCSTFRVECLQIGSTEQRTAHSPKDPQSS
jgi:hypothetical protein